MYPNALICVLPLLKALFDAETPQVKGYQGMNSGMPNPIFELQELHPFLSLATIPILALP